MAQDCRRSAKSQSFALRHPPEISSRAAEIAKGDTTMTPDEMKNANEPLKKADNRFDANYWKELEELEAKHGCLAGRLPAEVTKTEKG
jgi:hypothetical protein